jgi:hypothetical protein
MKLLLIVFLISLQCLKAQEALKIALLPKDTIYLLEARENGEISIQFDVQISNLSNEPIYLVAPKSYQLKKKQSMGNCN